MASKPSCGIDDDSISYPGGPRRGRRSTDRAHRAAAIDGLPAAEARRGHVDPVELLTDLASRGLLADTLAVGSPELRTVLSGAAYTLAVPVVFDRITRAVERGRGHHVCASSATRLADECRDGFTDDVEAVVTDLLRHADIPIRDVPAWMAGRTRAATVDAHRRRRGSRGALQRPRVPRWLVSRLAGDAWLVELARLVLVWVGIPNTAGAAVWPLDAWAHRRSAAIGASVDVPAVSRDVDTVLAAMRERPVWYVDYVERPLGHKQTTVAPCLDGAESAPFAFTSRDEYGEAHLVALAGAALDRIDQEIGRGGHPVAVVAEVIRALFVDDVAAVDVDLPPYTGADIEGRVAALLADRTELIRLARTVLEILDRPSHGQALAPRVQLGDRLVVGNSFGERGPESPSQFDHQ